MMVGSVSGGHDSLTGAVAENSDGVSSTLSSGLGVLVSSRELVLSESDLVDVRVVDLVVNLFTDHPHFHAVLKQ